MLYMKEKELFYNKYILNNSENNKKGIKYKKQKKIKKILIKNWKH